jgi:hypothetical protein
MKGRLAVVKRLLYSIPLAILFFVLLGCATTKPNLSVTDENYNPPRGSETDKNFLEAKSILAEISSQNPLLAIELGKLPELQDGISFQEKQALEILHRNYIDDTDSFDRAFEEMYKIGLPDVRKYCSPLQALFWLAEDNEIRSNSNLLINYSLEHLLAEAWKFDDFARLSEDQITEIINGIKNRKKREDYLARRKRLSTGRLQAVIIAAYKKNKYAFTEESRKMIEAIIDPRWQDFDIVTDRLNAPKLIDYYERKRFSYIYRIPDSIPIRHVFKHNEGGCISVTAFTVFCLRKAGYRATEIRTAGYLSSIHALTLFEMNGQEYCMDNGRPRPKGIFPYEAIKK